MINRTFSFRPLVLTAALLVALGGCGGGGGQHVGDIVSSSSFAAPSAIQADSTLLVHWMRGSQGKLIKASSLLFVPKGKAPASGWPLVAWVHATTTVGTGRPVATDCAPSLSPDIDGGLTAGGFTSFYVDHIAALVGAGFAVVAPDYEGLGAQAQADGTPYPYYNLRSSGNSVGAAVVAAHETDVPLSKNWAAVGHSEGGHAVMALETSASDAHAYPYKGTVAFAPYNSIEASVSLLGSLAAADPANAVGYRTVEELFVGMMSTALSTQRADFTPSSVMGADLASVMPAIKGSCIFPALGAVQQAVTTRTPAAFQGHTVQWASFPAMAEFLRANDLAVQPGFKVTKPTLVLQGGADPFVFESLQTQFVGRLAGAGMPVTYRTYPTADHGTIMNQGRSDMLDFLRANLQ